jgi:hypothetical protein
LLRDFKTIEAKVKPVSYGNDGNSNSFKIVQISVQKLIFNDEECSILRIRDITALKRLNKVERKN